MERVQEGGSLILVVSGNWGRVVGKRRLYSLQMSLSEFPAGFSEIPTEHRLSRDLSPHSPSFLDHWAV